jgi:hypothetical protein
VANYLGPWSKILETAGYPPEDAKAAALQVLPDILRYDPTRPPFYPNGRRLIEDVYSYRFAWLSYGKVPRKASNPMPICCSTSLTSAHPTPKPAAQPLPDI